MNAKRSYVIGGFGAVLAVGIAVLFGPPQEWARENMAVSTIAKKSESVNSFMRTHSKAEGLLRSVTERTEMLLTGDCRSVVVERTNDGGVAIQPENESDVCRVAATVPVAADGYFLTAGHAVVGSSAMVLVFLYRHDGELQARTGSARVVWAPADWRKHPDFAVVHADVGPIEPFTLADSILSDDFVVVTGSAGMGSTAVGNVLTIVEVPPGQGEIRFRLVHHNAPTMKGDSGGALVDENGHLIGINSGSHPPDWIAWLPGLGARISNLTGGRGSYSQAVGPYEDWLVELIRKDREIRH